MVQYITTPWRSRSELLSARSSFYPSILSQAEETKEGQRKAVARVGVWVQRGNCPHLVESTAILTSAVLNDVSSNERYCVRAAYASAFCRFVTGLLDSHQDKRHKLSMYSIAKTIGLPATYVELRHQATHEELPSLAKLRSATQKALRWIWDYYWVHLVDEGGDEGCKVFLRRLVLEEEEERRESREGELGRWEEGEVMEALIELQGEIEEPDVLLRVLRLQRRIVNGTVKVGNSGASTPKWKQVMNMDMDAVRAEMMGMEDELSKRKDLGERIESSDMVVEVDSSQGWSMWEGSWVPKPIGVV